MVLFLICQLLRRLLITQVRNNLFDMQLLVLEDDDEISMHFLLFIHQCPTYSLIDHSFDELMIRQSTTSAGAALNTDEGQRISPSSFSLRVGNACVLVTILPKNALQMSSVRPLLSPLAILRTPELFCSLIGTWPSSMKAILSKESVCVCVRLRM